MKNILLLCMSLLVLSCSSDIDVYDAARQGNLEIITKSHAEDEKSIDLPNERGHTPFILSCYRNQPEAAKLLIELGVDVNYSCDLGTALHAAVYKKDLEITELLLNNGIDIDAVDPNNSTALMMAVHASDENMVALLMKYNADVKLVDAKGKTAFVYAIEQKSEKIVQLLRN